VSDGWSLIIVYKTTTTDVTSRQHDFGQTVHSSESIPVAALVLGSRVRISLREYVRLLCLLCR